MADPLRSGNVIVCTVISWMIGFVFYPVVNEGGLAVWSCPPVDSASQPGGENTDKGRAYGSPAPSIVSLVLKSLKGQSTSASCCNSAHILTSPSLPKRLSNTPSYLLHLIGALSSLLHSSTKPWTSGICIDETSRVTHWRAVSATDVSPICSRSSSISGSIPASRVVIASSTITTLPRLHKVSRHVNIRELPTRLEAPQERTAQASNYALLVVMSIRNEA